jgi:hypothetical protein
VLFRAARIFTLVLFHSASLAKSQPIVSAQLLPVFFLCFGFTGRFGDVPVSNFG